MRPIMYLIMSVSAILIIMAQVMLKSSLKAIGPTLGQGNLLHSVLALLRQPLFWSSVALSGIVFLLTIYSLLAMPLSTFAPLYIVIYFIGLLFMSAFILHENVSLIKISGYGFLIVGMILIGKAG